MKFRQENAAGQSYFQEIKSNSTAATNLILNIFTVVLFVRGGGRGEVAPMNKQAETGT